MGEMDRFWRGIARVAVLLFERVLGWRIEVRGLEHVPREGGAVLAFNHHGYGDVVFLCWGPTIRLRRPVRFLAKAELFRHWATGWIVRAGGAVPVERSSVGGPSRAHAYAAAVDALRHGELVAVAPEQTISASYELLPFRLGAARMAIEADAPLVPAIGWGSHRSLPKGRPMRLVRRLPVVIRYAEPIHPRPGETAEQLTARLREQMTRLLDEVQRAYPPAVPGDDWWVPARLGGSAPDHDAVVAAHEARFAIDRRHRERHEGNGVST